MASIKVKAESLPARCEVCHQSDLFDPKRNYCQRCAGITLPTLPVSRLSTPNTTSLTAPEARRTSTTAFRSPLFIAWLVWLLICNFGYFFSLISNIFILVWPFLKTSLLVLIPTIMIGSALFLVNRAVIWFFKTHAAPLPESPNFSARMKLSEIPISRPAPALVIPDPDDVEDESKLSAAIRYSPVYIQKCIERDKKLQTKLESAESATPSTN